MATDVTPQPIDGPRASTVLALGTAQTLSWASSYYLPAVLAAPMAHSLATTPATVFLGFSLALTVSALVGPAAGRMIDRLGGRPVLLGTHGVFAASLVLLALASTTLEMHLAWVLMGLAMGSGLYDAAFATLVRLHGERSRNAITGITLIAGFASTVGWPLSAAMAAQWDWRGACLGWALLHLGLGLPLTASLPRVIRSPLLDPVARPVNVTSDPAAGPATPDTLGARVHPVQSRRHQAWLLAGVFALAWYVSTAMASHLPTLLQASGASLGAAVAIGALVGPAQVAGRLLEFGLLRHVHPLLSARLAGLAHPLGVIVLLAAGPAGASAFAILHGGGNGVMTVAKGTLPLALFGPLGYGALQGWLMMPARMAQALAPVSFGLVLEHAGANALLLSGGLGVLAFAALMTLRAPTLNPSRAD